MTVFNPTDTWVPVNRVLTAAGTKAERRALDDARSDGFSTDGHAPAAYRERLERRGNPHSLRPDARSYREAVLLNAQEADGTILADRSDSQLVRKLHTLGKPLLDLPRLSWCEWLSDPSMMQGLKLYNVRIFKLSRKQAIFNWLRTNRLQNLNMVVTKRYYANILLSMINQYNRWQGQFKREVWEG